MVETLGKVTVPVPGTPVRLTINRPVPTDRYACHAILVQAVFNNTGRVYVGTSAMNKATLANVHAQLAIPTANQIPSFSAALTIAPNAIQAQDIFLDADVAGEGAIVTALIA